MAIRHAMILGIILTSMMAFAGGGGAPPRNPIHIYTCYYNAFEKVNGLWQLQNTSSYDTTNLGVACNVASRLCYAYLQGISKYTGNPVNCLIQGANPQLLD